MKIKYKIITLFIALSFLTNCKKLAYDNNLLRQFPFIEEHKENSVNN